MSTQNGADMGSVFQEWEVANKAGEPAQSIGALTSKQSVTAVSLACRGA